MTIIVHPVGQGDLRNDIVGLSDEERADVQEDAEQQIDDALKSGNDEELLKLLLNAPDGDSRFSAPPLSLILRALSRDEGERAVTVLLLASRSGNPKTQTWPIGELLKKALDRAGVRDRLLKDLRLDVNVEMVEANLFEAAGVKELTTELQKFADSGNEQDVVVNGISGATMVALGAMGAADQLGLNWKAAVAPGKGKDTAVLLDRSSYDDAPFYWLRSLGYVEQARDWAEGRAYVTSDGRVELDKLADLMEQLAKDPSKLDDGGLASLLALDMARADNGAGLVARAWLEKHYRTRHAKEFAGQSNAPDDLVTAAERARNGKPQELGKVLKAAQEGIDRLGNQCPSSVRWLGKHQWLNKIGTDAVHDLAAPSASEVQRTLSLDKVSAKLPKWVACPGRGAVLFVVPCGIGAPRGGRVTERVLSGEPDKEIRRAVPGAMLDGAGPLPVEFLFLHSTDLRSKKTALDEATASFTARVDAGWERHTPVLGDLCDYGGGDESEYVATPLLMRIVSGQITLALEAKRPAAVVIVGTGQKAAVLGALEAAQKWCAEHATPLFLQTFVDKKHEKGKESVSQLHRLALHSDAEAALREAALSSLRSLNLLSAIRVLAAGDRDMDELADECEALRQQLLKAANATVDPDHGAGVLIDLLQTVAELWKEASEFERMRLAVVVAEAVQFKTPGRRLLIRNNNLGDGQPAGIDLRRPCPTDCGNRGAKDRGAHRDLLQILYEVRNRLVVTHGTNAVEGALQSVLVEPKMGATATGSWFINVGSIDYKGLLRLTCKQLTEAATILQINLNSTWEQDFKNLRQKIDPGQK